MKQEKKLEEAKRLYQTANADQRYVLESLFPELKESEYEKNIKDLIDELKCSLRAANCQNEACNGGHEKRIALLEWAISWLEKQGKLNGETTFQVWKDMRLEVFAQASGGRHESNCSDDCTKMFSLCDIDEIILNITEKQGENSPVLSNSCKTGKDEKDERIRKALIEHIKSNCESGFLLFQKCSPNDAIAWLEKLEGNKSEEYVFSPMAGCSIDKAARQAIDKIKNGENIVFSFNGFYMKIYNDTTVDSIIKSYNDFCKKQSKQEPPQVYETVDGETITYSESEGYKWTEEDEKNWSGIINEIKANKSVGQMVNI